MMALSRPELSVAPTGAKVQVAATSHMLQACTLTQEASSIWTHMRTGQRLPEMGVFRGHWAVYICLLL